MSWSPSRPRTRRELSWSTGLRLNDYVLHGVGDPREIMDNEFDAFPGRSSWPRLTPTSRGHDAHAQDCRSPLTKR
ncbi:hypothetical protein [Saccharopolyspora taberi]|uniref:Uncharacterized protein n=1 Tax=Saccharopolyspora taberi TaxID=60895 RepID=A0ABN3VEM2_9PSEU